MRFLELLSKASSILILGLMAVGCLPASNPYDPSTPSNEQAAAQLRGWLLLNDVEIQSYKISLLDALGNPIRKADGALAEVNTRIAGDDPVPGMETAVAGSFYFPELTPGTYGLVFDAQENARVDVSNAQIRNLVLNAGESPAPVVLAPQQLPQDSFTGGVQVVLENNAPGDVIVVTLENESQMRRVEIASAPGAVVFSNMTPGEWTVTINGEGYAPSRSANLQVVDELLTVRMSLLSLGPLFSLTDFSGTGLPLAPYFPEDIVRDENAIAGTITAHVRLDAGLILAQSPNESLSVEIRVAEAESFATASWQAGDAAEIPVTLNATLPDGPREILGQLRICFAQQCECPSINADGACDDSTFRMPLVSGLTSLEVIVDRQGPRAVFAEVGSEPRVSRPQDAAENWMQTQLISCAQFGSPFCDEASETEYRAPFVLELLDEVGRVYAYDTTLDDENAPSTLAELSGLGTFVSVSSFARSIAKEEGTSILRIFASDAAGNVSIVEERLLQVDVTPLELENPPLSFTETLASGNDDFIISSLFKADVSTTEGIPARWRLRQGNGNARLIGTGIDEFISYTGPMQLQVQGESHLDEIDLWVDVEDEAGNRTQQLASQKLVVSREGHLTAQIKLENAASMAGVQIALLRQGTVQLNAQLNMPASVDLGGPTLATLALDDEGNILAQNLPVAVSLQAATEIWTLSISAPEPWGEREVQIPVAAAKTTAAGMLDFQLPRGAIAGRFALAGQVETLNNSGIQVSLLDADGQAVAGAATLADGSFRFENIPVGTYSMVGASAGHLASTVLGLVVSADETYEILPNPIELTALSGDFTLCAATGVLNVDCPAIFYSNASMLQVGGIDFTGFTEFRLSTSAFGENATAPAWQPIVSAGSGDFAAPEVSLGAQGEGRYSVFLQLRVDASNAGNVLQSDIIYDATAPVGQVLTLKKSANARLESFTNESLVDVKVAMPAAGADEAPLSNHRIIFASSRPNFLPDQTLCPILGDCSVPLDDETEGVHSAWVFTCDAANNCTAAADAPSAEIIYDVTPPKLSHGSSFVPIGAGIVQVGNAFLTTTANYSMRMNVGTAKTELNTLVEDLNGQPVADVVGYRFSLDSLLAGASEQYFEPLLTANDTRDVTGAALPPVNGEYSIYVQLIDGAGNRTDVNVPLSVSLTLDTVPPTLSFDLNNGAEFTSSPTVNLNITENAVDPVVKVWLSEDANFTSSYEERSFPLAQTTYAFSAAAAPVGDGNYTLYARFFDAAGNFTDRSASIILDRSAPQATFVSCQNCSSYADQLYAPSTNVTLNALAQDNLGQVQSISVAISHDATGDSAALQTESYDGNIDVNLIVLSNGLPSSPAGLYTISVTFTDPAGNESQPTVLSVALDSTSPTAPSALNISARAARIRLTSPSPCTAQKPCTNDRRPILSFTGSTDNLDANPRYVVELAENADFDGQLVAQAERSTALPLQVPVALLDGTYGFRVKAVDQAGNIATSAVALFIVDTTGPDAPSLLPISSPLSKNMESNIFVRWVDDSEAISYDLQMAQDGVGFSSPLLDISTVNSQYDVRSSLQSGEAVLHHIRVRAKDALGNGSAWSFAQLVHDDVAPCASGTPVVSLLRTNGNSYTSSSVVALTLNCPGGGQDTMQLACDGVVNAESNESFANVSSCSLPDGLRTVAAHIFDKAGNRTIATSDSIYVDRTSPSIPRFADQGATTNNTSFAISALALTSIDAGAGLSSPGYLLHWPRVVNDCPEPLDATGWCPWNGSLALSLTLIEGENRIRVRAKDQAGNVSDDDQLVVVLDTQPPAAVVNLQADAGNGEVTVTWDAPADTDVAGYEVFYSAPTSSACSSQVSDYSGRNADQGESPLNVGNNEVLRLTGLAAGTPICVAVRAFDAVNNGVFTIFPDPLLPNEISPKIVGNWQPPINTAVRAVAERNQILYVTYGCKSTATCAGGGLSAIDISDPKTPIEIGSCSNSSYTGMFDISLLGNYAYAANGKWIEIIDISDPTSLICSSYTTVPNQGAAAADWAMSVATSPGDGNGPAHMVVAALDAGVWTYTLNNPTSPTQVGNYKNATAGNFRAHTVTLQGDYAYIAYAEHPKSGVQILDISNIANPTPAGTTIQTVPTWDVVVSGSRVVIARNGGVFVYDVPDPSIVQDLDLGTPIAQRSGQPKDLLMYGPYIYLADQDTFNGNVNIDVVSQRNMSNPEPNLPLAGRSTASSYSSDLLCSVMSCGSHPDHEIPQARRMEISGLYLYEANADAGLIIRRLSRPISLEEISNQSFKSPVNQDPGGLGISIYGHRALFGRNGHIAPVDLSDPENPVQLTPTSIDNATTTLEQVGDRFIIGGGTGFKMVRPNPDNTFTITATWNDTGASRYTKKTITSYPYVYLIDGDDSYYASNASLITVDMRSMTTLSTQPLNLGVDGYWYGEMIRHHNVLYITAARQTKLGIVSLANPAAPALQPAVDVGISVFGLRVSRNRLLISTLYDLRSYDISAPVSPANGQTLDVKVGRWFDISGDILLGATKPRGVVISIDDISSPTLVGYGGNISLEMNALLFGKHAILTDRHDFSMIALE